MSVNLFRVPWKTSAIVVLKEIGIRPPVDGASRRPPFALTQGMVRKDRRPSGRGAAAGEFHAHQTLKAQDKQHEPGQHGH